MTPNVARLAGLAPSSETERRLVRSMQVALVGITGYGVLAREGGVFLPAVVGIGITLVPALLRREYGYAMHGGLVLWIATAVFLHAVGSLGVYARYRWFDEITHAVSAAFVAAVGFAAFRALELHTEEVDVPDAFRGVFIVVFVLSFAVLWEVLEFALGDLVRVYGVDDIATDMLANTAGAVVVAVLGGGPVDGLVEFFRDRLGSEAE